MPDLVFFNSYTYDGEDLKKREERNQQLEVGNRFESAAGSVVNNLKLNFSGIENEIHGSQKTISKQNNTLDDHKMDLENAEQFVNKCGDIIHICQGVTLNDEQIQAMFRTAAKKGDGFAVDELGANGIYQCKLIRDPEVLVVLKEPKMEIVGTLVHGLPVLCRTPGPVATAYIIVKESERRKGNGQILYSYLMKMLNGQQYFNTILFDVFKTNEYVLSWLFRKGYNVTGTIKYSGYISGSGHTDTLVLYKDLD